MNKLLLLLLLLPLAYTFAQQNIEGRVVFKEGMETSGLYGANIYWLNSREGVISNENGKFSIKWNTNSNKLVISYIGFKTDTLNIKDLNKFIIAELEA